MIQRAQFTVEAAPSRNRMLLLRMWDLQKGRCYWCRELALKADQQGYFRSSGGLSARAATIDHVYSRLHPLRNKPGHNPQLVMACSKCNGRRSKVECEAFAKDGRLEPRIYRPDEGLNDIWSGVKRKAKAIEGVARAAGSSLVEAAREFASSPRCHLLDHEFHGYVKDRRRGVAHGVCACGKKSDWVVFVA